MNYQKTIELLKNIILTNSIFTNNVYLVGGCVRDLILGLEPKDIDLCIDVPNGVELFSNWLKKDYSDITSGFCEFPRYGTMKFSLHLNDGEIVEVECVIPRVETYNEGPRKPDQIKQSTIQEDALRRDFCCNALYQRLSDGEILDPTGYGIRDCENKVLGTPLKPESTFIDDPLRMLRAIRFKCTKGFDIAKEDLKAIKPYSNYSKLSKERIRDEFEKILMSPNPVEGIKLLHEHDLLSNIIPELEEAWDFDQKSRFHSLSLTEHLFSVLNIVKDCEFGGDLRLRWAALLHDISKYKCYTWDGEHRHFKLHELSSATLSEKILKRLKYDNSTTYDIKELVKNHMRLKQQYDYKTNKYSGSDKSIRKLLSLGSLLPLELELIEADNMSHSPKYNMPGQIRDVKEKLTRFCEDKKINSSIISGDDIMEYFKIGPGINIKEIKMILQDYLDEDPRLEKQELFDKYQQEFQGSFHMIKKDYDDIEMIASLDDVQIVFPIKEYFGNNNPLPNSTTFLVTGLYYPLLYKRLVREKKVRSLINTASKSITQISMEEGFRGIHLSLVNGDLCATITWSDGTITDIL